MAQVRDAAFNPPSPHSSSAGADSYKHEGTPETRLTVFSPDDGSARSNKMPMALSLNAPSDHSDGPVHFHRVNAIGGFGDPSAAAEKDPFVSSTTVAKGEQKLSPTASAFRPVSVPLVAHGSLNAPPGMNAGLGANRQLFAPQATARFSTELGVSRCLVLYSPSQPVTLTEVEGYLEVRKDQSPLIPCQQDADSQHRNWSVLDRRARASATRFRLTARCFFIFPTSVTPATPTIMFSLVLPTGGPSILRQSSSTVYACLPANFAPPHPHCADNH
jgi:hypothetical protein